MRLQMFYVSDWRRKFINPHQLNEYGFDTNRFDLWSCGQPLFIDGKIYLRVWINKSKFISSNGNVYRLRLEPNLKNSKPVKYCDLPMFKSNKGIGYVININDEYIDRPCSLLCLNLQFHIKREALEFIPNGLKKIIITELPNKQIKYKTKKEMYEMIVRRR